MIAKQVPMHCASQPVLALLQEKQQAAKAVSDNAAPKKAASALEEDAEDLDPNLYFERRVRAIQVSPHGGLQGPQYFVCQIPFRLSLLSCPQSQLRGLPVSEQVSGVASCSSTITPAGHQNGSGCRAL